MHGRLILGLFLLFTGAKAWSAQLISYGASHALVVGVSRYTNGWPSLPNVAEETRSVQAALEKHGYQVHRVLDPDVKGLREAFEKFIQEHGARPENRLLFYFSGHGFTSNRRGFLVAADAPELEDDGTELREKSLPMSQLLTWCREMKSKHALFLFDSCFYDSVFPSVALPQGEGWIGQSTGRPVRQFITAGTAGEQLPNDSVFAQMLVRGMRGEADLTRDSSITGTELGRYLHERLIYYESGQTPQYGKIRDPNLDEGDFVLVLSSQSSMASAREMYPPIFEAIKAADALVEAGQGRAALEKYLLAQRDLRQLKKDHADWRPEIVSFRLKYLNDRIGPLQVRYPGTRISSP